MRAAIYARFSTDKQSDTSTEDQRRLCEARMPTGTKLVAFHADDAVSGSMPMRLRAGGQALIADILAGVVEILLVESLDRISRDQVDLEQTVRLVERAGVRILGVSDGYDSQAGGRKVLRTMRGLIGELYLDDLREKTRRGLIGKVQRGFVATGPSYGYRLVKEEGGSRYRIDPEQAEVVRKVFDRYASGQGIQSIVHDLNARGIPSPRGGTWAVSAVYGNPGKGSGILNNSLYVGKLIYNRSQWIKDPATGRRQRVDRPQSEWIESEDESLRIVNDETWQRVRSRIDAGRDKTGYKPRGRPARTVFGGLLRCPNCQGRMIAVDRGFYGCSAHKDRGPSVCEGFRLRRDRVDQGMTAILRVMLESPACAEEFKRQMREQLDEDSSARTVERLRTVERQIGKLVEAITEVGISEALSARLAQLEKERDRLREEQAAAPMEIDIDLLWKEMKSRLTEMLTKGDPGEMRAAVAACIEPILVKVNPATGTTYGEVIVRALAAAERPGKQMVVAGAGFEPATFGL